MEATMTANTPIAKQSISRRDLAVPLNYQVLFILFLFGSVAGFFVEGVCHIIKAGTWESHAAAVWGPFCIIYGVGLLAVYILACLLPGCSTPWLFAAFTLSGAVIEYFASLVQEMWLGSTSWDYSGHFLNIGGRVSLQMALFWGILGLVFVRFLYSPLQYILDRMHGKWLSRACVVLSIFMVVDLLITAAALNRWKDRQNGQPASTAIELALDKHFDDATMADLFPNMVFQS